MLGLLLSFAFAQDRGIPVTVVVQDVEGAPIPSAQIRHLEEDQKHRVNTEDASWTADVIYLAGGEPLVFRKKMRLPLEVTAPGFRSRTVELLVRKKPSKNRLVVRLERLDLQVDQTLQESGPSIGFRRDKPLDR